MKIVSDGTPTGTRILLDDGSELPNVFGLTWSVFADGKCYATIYVENVELESEVHLGSIEFEEVGGG